MVKQEWVLRKGRRDQNLTGGKSSHNHPYLKKKNDLNHKGKLLPKRFWPNPSNRRQEAILTTKGVQVTDEKMAIL